MSKYIRLQGTAARLIKSNGASFQVRRMIPGTEDPITGTVSGETPDVQDVDAVILLFGSQIKNNPVEGFLGENGIQSLMKMNNILFSAADLKFPLEPQQEIYYEDQWWIIEFLSPLKPDGKTTILYKGFIRRP